MSTLDILFTPVDSLLFKPALSPDGMGARLLASDFPPPRHTLVGALRSAIGERLGANWAAYRQGQAPDIEQVIGRPDQALPEGARVYGPWLALGTDRLLPLPLCFLARELGAGEGKRVLEVAALEPSSERYSTDLGSVRLPMLKETLAGKGFRARSDIWITDRVLEKLKGSFAGSPVCLEPDEYFSKDELFTMDDRLGIGMNSKRRTVEEGLLYQTRHVRLRPGVSLMLRVEGWPAASQADGTQITLGADGRLAGVQVRSAEGGQAASAGTLWVAAAPLPMGERGTPLVLQEQPVECAAVGKPVKRGGWSLKHHRSKPVQNFVPAGSAYWLAEPTCLAHNPDLICIN